MKKFLVLALCALVAFSACDRKKNVTPVEPENDTTEVVAALNVEHAIATDRETMFAQYSEWYKWYETCVTYKNYLDEENDGEIEAIRNVFQVIEKTDEDCFDTYVVQIYHTADGKTETEVTHSFWLEDMPLNREEINVTFDEAFEKMNESNLTKPHSRNCVLRKQVAPKRSNAQYIFGNMSMQIYVDAQTGETTDDNPAFAFKD